MTRALRAPVVRVILFRSARWSMWQVIVPPVPGARGLLWRRGAGGDSFLETGYKARSTSLPSSATLLPARGQPGKRRPRQETGGTPSEEPTRGRHTLPRGAPGTVVLTRSRPTALRGQRPPKLSKPHA